MNHTTNTSPWGRPALWIALAGLALVAGAAGYGLAQWRAHDASSREGHAAVDIAVSAPAAITGASAAKTERKVLYWYDPMEPAQHFDKPGKSPFMDMQLVPKYADEDPGAGTGVAVDPRLAQTLGMRVAEVKRETLGGGLTLLASVGFNERDVAIVQSRTNGFVERVHPLAPGDVVRAGSPIADVLVPEWAGAQQEYLAVRAGGDAGLTAASRQRLQLLGMSPALIAEVERSGRPHAVQTIAAPIGGVVAEIDVRNGMSVAAGMTLARINGLSSMWLEAALPEVQAAAFAPGRAVEVRLPAYPGEVFRGSVIAVLPEANRETRTLRVRMSVANAAQKLKAGMTAQVTLPGSRESALVVPSEAVVRSGQRTLVFIVDADGKHYRPVPVELGREVGDKIVVAHGLSEGQRIVTSGQFLIDSEASLSGVMPRGEVAGATAPSPAAAPTAAPAPSEAGAPVPAGASAPAADPHARHKH